MSANLSKLIPLLMLSSVLAGCVTTSNSQSVPLNQGNWPLFSAIGGLAGGGLGAIENSTWAAGGAVVGAVIGGLICYAQDGDEDGDGVFEPVRVELDVKFDFDKSVVKAESQADIKSLADFMKLYPQTITTVEGHTDAVGTDAYNQGLSERRAHAVRDVLVNQHGIETSRVSSVGYGESRPVADNTSESGRAINRRVEAEVEARP